MRRRYGSMLIIAYALAACSAKPSVTQQTGAPTTVVSTGSGTVVQIEDDMELETPLRHAPARVWAILPTVFQEFNLGAGVLDESRRIYGNDKVSANRIAGQSAQTLVRCANEASGMGSTMRYRVQIAIRTAVTDGPEGSSKLNTSIAAQATPIDGSSASKLDCVSNGKLEREIRRAVIAKLGK
ncbi:MAG TPA: hypothetical protein VGC44_11770 [Longimicrobiales bacterium]